MHFEVVLSMWDKTIDSAFHHTLLRGHLEMVREDEVFLLNT